MSFDVTTVDFEKNFVYQYVDTVQDSEVCSYGEIEGSVTDQTEDCCVVHKDLLKSSKVSDVTIHSQDKCQCRGLVDEMEEC